MLIRPALLVPLALCAGLMTTASVAAAGAPVPAPLTAPAAGANVANAGTVKRIVGNVTLERAGQTRPAVAGMAVQVGDTVRTGPESAVGITLADDMRLAAGAKSELVISEFIYNATRQEGSVLISLWRGALNVATGSIAKKSPEQVNVRTRTVVLGVRGTEFIVESSGAAE